MKLDLAPRELQNYERFFSHLLAFDSSRLTSRSINTNTSTKSIVQCFEGGDSKHNESALRVRFHKQLRYKRNFRSLLVRLGMIQRKYQERSRLKETLKVALRQVDFNQEQDNEKDEKTTQSLLISFLQQLWMESDRLKHQYTQVQVFDSHIQCCCRALEATLTRRKFALALLKRNFVFVLALVWVCRER